MSSYTGARKLRADDYPDALPERRLSLVEAVDLEYPPTLAENGRRTVKITGQPTPPRRRPNRAQ